MQEWLLHVIRVSTHYASSGYIQLEKCVSGNFCACMLRGSVLVPDTISLMSLPLTCSQFVTFVIDDPYLYIHFFTFVFDDPYQSSPSLHY